MEKLIYLDTHAVVWLYAGELALFPKEARHILEDRSLGISPIVLLELQYLYEIGRIKIEGQKVYKSLEKSIGLKVVSSDFQKIIAVSLGQNWTRDPFDRIIVAQASADKAMLMTKDDTIRKHYQAAIWK